MSEPLEEQAIVAIIELLLGMTDERSWGGAYPNPPMVVRERPVSFDAIPHFPYLVVALGVGGSTYDLSETAEGLVTAGGALGYKNTLICEVVGFVLPTTDVAGDTWLLRLRKDVLETLCGRAEALSAVPACRSIWPTGDTVFVTAPPPSMVAAFAQEYALTFDETLTLA